MTSNGTDNTNIAQPTIADLFKLMQDIKNDTETTKTDLISYAKATNSNFEMVHSRIDDIDSFTANNRERIESLEVSIEILKQDQLKNNICISGVPMDQIVNANTKDIVIAIAKTLGVELSSANFASYPIAKNKFIIVNMYNIAHKQLLLNKIRTKKSLLVEEVFKIQSNSQIYLNDHLTSYFNKLYLIARTAKKEGKLASASSYGGRIRARKSKEDAPSIIYTEMQIQKLVDKRNDNQSNTPGQLISDSSESNTSTPNITNTHKKKRAHKRKSAVSTPKDIKSQDKENTKEKKGERAASAQRTKQQQAYDSNRTIPSKKQRTDTNSNTAAAELTA